MSAAMRCIFLAGAPEAEALSWDEPRLISEFQAPIQRFLGRKKLEPPRPVQSSSAGGLARWRSVAYDDNLSKQQLP